MASEGESMKKVISALLTILVIIAFVSCDNQVITEKMRANATEDFFETYEQFYNYKSLINGIYAGEHDLSKWDNKANAEEMEVYIINKIIQILLDVSSKTEYEITDATGIIKVTSENELDTYVVAEGVSISYSYTKDGDKIEEQLTLECHMSEEFDNTTDKNQSGTTIVEALVKNGFTYKAIKMDVEFVNGDRVVTRAVCNGITLDNNLIQERLKKVSRWVVS